jgi:hypothetical protein
MDLDKLEKLANLVLNEKPASSSSHFDYNPLFEASFRNLMVVANNTLPEYNEFFSSAIDKTHYVSQAKLVIHHLLDILEIEKESKTLIKEMKIFESADEKMKQAGLCFQNEDYSSTFHNLNTALELIIKDKVGIPTTITGIKTANVIELLVKYKTEQYPYFNEVRKRVIDIDNKSKHQSYLPSKLEAINGIRAMEDLISKLRNTNLEISEELRNKIFEGL